MEKNVFTEKSIPATYMRFAMPLVCIMLVTMIYNIVDTYFVASTGDTNIVAGVAIIAPMFTILMGYGNIFAQGGSSLISRFMGAKNFDGVKHVSAFCIYICFISCAILSAILMIFRNPVLHLLGANDDTWIHAYEYYKIYVSFGALTAVSFVFSNLMRSSGLAAKAMISTITGSIVNIILDPIFIIHMGMGAKGAAIASCIGFFVQDGLSLIIITKYSKDLSLNPKDIPLPFSEIKDIIAIGIPTAVTNVMAAFASAMMNQSLLVYGTIKVAAMGIAGRAVNISSLITSGITFGGMPVLGYFYGAKDWKTFLEVRKFSTKLVSIVSIAISVVFFVFAPLFMRFFMDNPQIIADGTIMMRISIVTVIFAGLTKLYTINFQATGNATASFLISISRQGVFFVIVLFLFKNIFGYYGVLATNPVVDVLAAIFAWALLRRQYKKLDMQE